MHGPMNIKLFSLAFDFQCQLFAALVLQNFLFLSTVVSLVVNKSVFFKTVKLLLSLQHIAIEIFKMCRFRAVPSKFDFLMPSLLLLEVCVSFHCLRRTYT
jgi:hypothetical protein